MTRLACLALALVLGSSLGGCGRELEAPKPSLAAPEEKTATQQDIGHPPIPRPKLNGTGVDVPPRGAAPPGNVLVEGRVEPSKVAAKDSDYEQRVADARRTVDITVYGASWCPSCRQARAWLDENGMAYSERDIDRSAEASRTMRRLNPAGTIPVIDVEGEVVVGFAPDAVNRAIRRRAERRVRN